MANRIVKCKFRGRKRKIRILGNDEIITKNCLQYMPYSNASIFDSEKMRTDFSDEEIINMISSGAFNETLCVGESTAEHKGRVYIEPLDF